MAHIFALSGCAPEPLIHYLKSLGILRLIAKQKDPGVRAWWQGNSFFINTELSREQLFHFFLEEYVPSPIIAPWNGGSGFYGGSAAQYIKQIEISDSERFEPYRKTIQGCREIIYKLGLQDKPNDKQKPNMLALCRSFLPDDAVEVMDSLYIITGESSNGSVDWQRKFAPIFGSGGNDGRLEFTYTFLKYLQLVVPLSGRQKLLKSNKDQLEKALYNSGSPVLAKNAVGQYHPGGVGGPNSARGDKDISLVNPWDYILAFEGALLFAGAAVRRFTLNERLSTEASFPFSVSASAAGWETLPASEIDDRQKNRGEIWLPLWGNPTSFGEIKYVFAEGRVQLGRRRAISGLDFARAIGALGIDRGIYAFQRVGMMAGDRNGKAHLAVSLGNFTVQPRPEVNLLSEIDFWLDRFRRICSDAGTPARYRRELRAIEEAIFAFCQYGGAPRMQKILVALGSASQAVSLVALSKDKFDLKPLRLRSTDSWLEAIDDNSSEFRIASAIASIFGDSDGRVGGLRENIEPVVWDNKKKEYVWMDNNFNVPLTDFPRGLAEVLEKRMIAANKQNLDLLPLGSKLKATVADAYSYLRGELNEGKILDLLKGLVLLDYWEIKGKVFTPSERQEEVPVYSLLKLLFLPGPCSWPKGSEPVRIRPEHFVLSRLRGQDVSGAAKIALRRLRSSGFVPKLSNASAEKLIVSSDVARRLAGALLIPIYDWRRLADFALIKPENTERS